MREVFSYVSERLRNNREFLVECVSVRPELFVVLPDELRRSDSFIHECVIRLSERYNYISEILTFYDNDELNNILKAKENGSYSSAYDAYNAVWDNDGKIPEAGETRIIHVNSVFNVNPGQNFYALYHILERIVLCRLVNKDSALTVEVLKVYTASEFAKEDIDSSIIAPYYLPRYSEYEDVINSDSYGNPLSYETCAIPNVGWNTEWYTYTDSDLVDHVLLMRRNEFEPYYKPYTIGNLVLGNTLERRNWKLDFIAYTEDGRFEYGVSHRGFHITRYLKDDTMELNIPDYNELRFMYPTKDTERRQFIYRLLINGGTFYGCTKLETVRLPELCVAIEQYAFRNCKNLKKVYIPEYCHVHDDAFTGCSEELTLIIKKDSYAQNYALKNHIHFELTEES